MAKTFPRIPAYNPRRINRYVPGLQCAADVLPGGIYTTSLGTPALASATAILDSAAISDAASTISSFTDDSADANFGRNVTVKGDTAGDDAVVTVKGRDYLGQPMAEAFTLSGTGSQVGKKAFMWIDTIAVASGNGQASAIDVGWGALFGLPYATIKVLAETSLSAAGGTVAAETIGTLAQAIMVAQTSTTGDPRGTYDPGDVQDGTSEVVITAVAAFIDAMSSDDVALGMAAIDDVVGGGLYGLRHFYA